MKCCYERFEHAGKVFAFPIVEVNGVKYYGLSEVLEKLGLKDEKNTPIHIEADVVWGYHVRRNSFDMSTDELTPLQLTVTETAFVDYQCLKRLLESQN